MPLPFLPGSPLPSTALGATDLAAGVESLAVPHVSVIDSDTFARTTSNSWGTASDGSVWSLVLGTASTVSTNGTQGVAAYNSGARDLLILGANTTADGDFIARFTPQGSSDFVGFVVRYYDSTDYVRVTLNQGHFLTVGAVVSGAVTNYNISTTTTYTNGTAYWIRIRFIGQTFWGKWWQDGTPEPQAWTGSITNTTSPTTAGKFGAYMLAGTSGTSVTIDNLTYGDSGYIEPGAETASGSEVVGAPLVTFGVSDSALGDDSQMTLGLLMSDPASGTESVGAPFVTFGVSDAAGGADSVSALLNTFGVSDAASGAETVLFLPAVTDSATATDLAALAAPVTDGAAGNESSVSVYQSPVVLEVDQFNRTVSSTFGTASDGDPWTLILGAGATLSVNGSQGVVAYNSGARDMLTLGSGTTADGDFLARFTPAAVNDWVGFICRYTNSTNYTRMTLNQTKFLTVSSVVSGTVTNYNISSSATFTLGQPYWIRFRFIGQTFWGKWWADGTPEPQAWTGSITNTTSPTTAGGYGAYLLSSINGNFVTVDTLTLYNSGFADPGVETATGAETVALLLQFNAASDTAGGTDSVSSLGQLLTDSATGAEAVAVTIQMSVTDGASGTDGANLVGALAQDTFATRTVSNGFGVASDGQTWAQVVGHASAVSVAGGEGQIAYDGGAGELLLLGQNTTADGEVRFQFIPQGTLDYFGAVVRYFDPNNYTRIVWYHQTTLAVHTYVAGVLTSYTIQTTAPWSVGSSYWLHGRFVGQTFWAKVWPDGTNEPVAWGGSITNTVAPTIGGQFGLFIAAETAATTVQVDNYTLSNSNIVAPVDQATGNETISVGTALIAAFDNASATDAITNLFVTLTAPITPTAQDTFAGRTVANGWGTGSDRQVWSSSGSDLSVSSGGGHLAYTNGTTAYYERYGTNTAADMEVVARFTPGGASDRFGLLARYVSNTNFYQLWNNGGTLYLQVTAGGVQHNLATLAGFTVTGGTSYWLRARVQGTLIAIKQWQDGTSEPGLWSLSTTDSQVSGAGLPGIYLSNLTNGQTLTVDTFTEQDLSNTATGSEVVTVPQLRAVTDSAAGGETVALITPQVSDSATGAEVVDQVATVIVPGRVTDTTAYSTTSTTATVQLSGAGAVCADGDLLVHLTPGVGASDLFGIVWRYTDANNYLRIVVTGGAVTYIPRVGGVDGAVTTLSAAPTITAGQPYYLRVRIVGSQILHRLWADIAGAQPPTTWSSLLTAVDLLTSGQYGLYWASGTSGVATTANLVQMTPVSADTASASDTFTQTGIVVADTASGAESMAFTTLPISLADAASGAEAIAFTTIAVALADSATGSEAEAIFSANPIADTASGADTLLTVSGLPVVDSALAVDSLTAFFATEAISDSGAANESVLLTFQSVTVAGDSATATDAVTVSGTSQPSINESATGADSFTSLSVTLGLSDSAATIDAPTVFVTLAASDASSGADTLSALVVTLAISDTAIGADVPLVNSNVVDSALGGESVSILVTFGAATESAVGADALSALAVNIALTENASASESVAVNLPTGVSVSDTASGADAETIFTTFSLTDAGVATDGVVASNVFGMSDAASANDAAPVVLVSVTQSDAASTSDTVGAPLVTMSSSDTAAGGDAVAVFIICAVNDAALGNDSGLLVTAILSLPLDMALGGEAFALATVAFGMNDGANGAESVSVDTGGLVFSVTVSDQALGVEGVAIATIAGIFAPDAALGGETVSIVAANPTRFLLGNNHVEFVVKDRTLV